VKITIGLPSRGRPAGLLSVLKAFDALASGEHEVTYVVLVDDDDDYNILESANWVFVDAIPAGTVMRIGTNKEGLHKRFNEAMLAYPADIYSQATDDLYPLTYHWDNILVKAAEKAPAFSWVECSDPNNHTCFAVTNQWLEAVGRFYPEWFPFWFADTWIAEVYSMAFNEPPVSVRQLQMGGKRGVTTGMHNLQFWVEFFIATRKTRVEEAKRVAVAFGNTPAVGDCDPPTVRFKEIDAWQLSHIEEYEKKFNANQGEPSARYKAAYDRAQRWMKEPK
jgi:hypothetical protein